MKTIKSIWNFLVEWGVSWAEYRTGQGIKYNRYI